MADLDVFFAGGATGAMNRATQLVNAAAANAAAKAAAMARVTAPPPQPVPPPPAYQPPISTRSDDFRENRNGIDLFAQKPGTNMLDLPGLDVIQGKGSPPAQAVVGPPGFTPDHRSDDARENRNGQDLFNQKPAPSLEQMADVNRQDEATYRAYLHDREGAGNLTPGTKVSNSTIQQMLDDVEHDPLATPEKKQAAQEMADGFRQDSRFKLFTKDELVDNPILRTLNDLSVWSRFRQKVADWNAQKKKTGTNQQDNGDGTITSLIENGSFSSVTSPSNLSPYMVVRNEDGMLDVVTVDQWIQGKFTDMHNDPKYAAQVITALATASMYGSDSTANAQASRVALDRNGNPVKAIAGAEDLNALKQFANQAVIFQNQGDEVAADDVLGQLVQLGQQVSAQNGANGEHGGGGGGRFFGGGGSGGGSSGARLSDPAELSAQLNSVARTRLGQELTPEQQAAFVNYVHSVEANNWATYLAGGPYVQSDPQSQAIQWIEQHYGQSQQSYQYGTLAARFMQMMGGQNPFGGLS